MINIERSELYRRPEYTLENMGRVFVVLNKFGIGFSPQKQHEVDQLFCGIDFADQLTDNQITFPNAPENILSFLAGRRDFLPSEFPQPVVENFTFLKGIVERGGFGDQLEKTVGELLSLHEQLSSTCLVPEYVDLTKKEAVKSAEMAFLFLDEDLPLNVKEYLTQANILGNLADNLLDLESDYAEGQILIQPTNKLKLTLKLEIARQLVYLSWHYPKKKDLPGLTKKYLAMLLRPFHS